jgi:SM-20-related protein
MSIFDQPESPATGYAPAVLRIARHVGEQGWCLTPDFLPNDAVAALRRETLALWRDGAFRHAGVGRGRALELRPEVRTDRVHWLDPASRTPAQRVYLDALERLREALNGLLFLGLFDFEGHLAVYPAGSYYRKHLDQFRGVERRTLTTILYLNHDWGEEDGGQLRLYTDPRDEARFEEILPLGGRLVTFLSAQLLHEVLPARRERLSITGWFRRRGEWVL